MLFDGSGAAVLSARLYLFKLHPIIWECNQKEWRDKCQVCPTELKSVEEGADLEMEEADVLPVGAAGTSLGSAARSSLVLLLQNPHGGAHATLPPNPQLYSGSRQEGEVGNPTHG